MLDTLIIKLHIIDIDKKTKVSNIVNLRDQISVWYFFLKKDESVQHLKLKMTKMTQQTYGTKVSIIYNLKD